MAADALAAGGVTAAFSMPGADVIDDAAADGGSDFGEADGAASGGTEVELGAAAGCELAAVCARAPGNMSSETAKPEPSSTNERQFV